MTLIQENQPKEKKPTRKYTKYATEEERRAARLQQKREWFHTHKDQYTSQYQMKKQTLSEEEFQAWKKENNAKRRELYRLRKTS